MDEIAIVGAGPAGAGAAYVLGDATTVFEARDRVGGRAHTRRVNGCRFDVGANYVKAGDDRVSRLVTRELPTAGLVDVDAPVWTFDAAGRIEPGDDPDDHKWTYREGIDGLVARLLDRAGARVETGTRVESLDPAGDGWRLALAGGRSRRFDAVVLTPPGPAAADLLGACPDLAAAAAGVPYRTVVTVALSYPFEIDRPYYGLLNTDRGHEIGWLSREGCKPGHVPAGESLLIAQLSPDWSTAHYDDPPVGEVADLVADLLSDDRLEAPAWTDLTRWRYALPDAGIDADLVARARDRGLHLAGDWVAGEGRVHLALRSGLAAGDRLRPRGSSRRG